MTEKQIREYLDLGDYIRDKASQIQKEAADIRNEIWGQTVDYIDFQGIDSASMLFQEEEYCKGCYMGLKTDTLPLSFLWSDWQAHFRMNEEIKKKVQEEKDKLYLEERAKKIALAEKEQYLRLKKKYD
jgi:hypothetical protein